MYVIYRLGNVGPVLEKQMEKIMESEAYAKGCDLDNL